MKSLTLFLGTLILLFSTSIEAANPKPMLGIAKEGTMYVCSRPYINLAVDTDQYLADCYSIDMTKNRPVTCRAVSPEDGYLKCPDPI